MHTTFSWIVFIGLLLLMAACSIRPFETAVRPPLPTPTTSSPIQTVEPDDTPTSLPSATATSVPTATATSVPTATATPTAVGPLAPELEGGTGWLNSEPLTLEQLRGQVVLVNFWTYGCYNCQNTMPYVRQWWDSYAEQGLVIIGVHTPELSWEYPLENVQQAIINEGIGWPVVQDNDKQIWRAYNNRYWPRFYLIDHEGHIIYDHIGEGRYENTEQQIVEALAAAEAARPGDP